MVQDNNIGGGKRWPAAAGCVLGPCARAVCFPYCELQLAGQAS